MLTQLQYKESKLQYTLVGTGPAVVLLHGFGEDNTVWDFQKESLQQQFRVLIPDLPGSGGSGMIADMRMEGLADAVYALLQHEGIESCVLIGHSMGGYVALAFAEKYEAALTGFGLFHSSAYADSAEKKETRRKGIAFIKEHGAYNFLKTATPNLYSPATKEKHPALITRQVQKGNAFTNEALIAYYEAMIQRPDRTVVLRHATVPVLFVLGQWDTAVPLQDGLKQCYLPQNAYIDLLTGSGHMGMQEEHKRSNQLLRRYLSDIYHQEL